jgi:hypothetical protein
MRCIGEHLIYFYNKLQKISFKISFACKIIFGGKRFVVFFQSNPFGS